MNENMTPLKQLNLTDCFLFDEVMEDPIVHQDALSISKSQIAGWCSKNFFEYTWKKR